MKPGQHLIRRLACGLVLVALPLAVSHCARNQSPAVRGPSQEEISRLQDLHDHWSHLKPQLPQQLPDERLEALGDVALRKSELRKLLD